MAPLATEAILEAVIRFIANATANTAESSIAAVLHRQTTNHLTSAENAPLDFGLIAAPHRLESPRAAERVFEAWKGHPEIEDSVIGLDAKTFASVPRSSGTNDVMRTSFALSVPQQQYASAILLYSVRSPREVAVVPLWFYDYFFDYTTRKNIRESMGTSYHCRIIGSVPLPWDPCVMPMAYLGKNMDNILDFFHGRSNSWYVKRFIRGGLVFAAPADAGSRRDRLRKA